MGKEKTDQFKRTGEGRKNEVKIAEELGLLDRVLAQGWKSLTSKRPGGSAD